MVLRVDTGICHILYSGAIDSFFVGPLWQFFFPLFFSCIGIYPLTELIYSLSQGG